MKNNRFLVRLGQADDESAPFSCKENDAVGDLDMQTLTLSEVVTAPPRVSLLPFEDVNALCTSTPIEKTGTGAEKKGGTLLH